MDTYMRSKLYVPCSADLIVPRQCLYTILDNVFDNKTVFISAPAGYGKTTTVVGWLQERGLECAWVSLDEDDGIPGRLLQYISAAVGRYIPDAFLSPEANQHARLDKLLFALQDCGQEFAIVLDDFHHINDPLIHHMVRRLIQYKPREIHIIIISRGGIPFSLQPALLRQNIILIKDAQILFDRKEVQSFFLLRQVPLNQAQADILMRHTEGWPCALVALSLVSPSHLESIPSLENNEFIHGFLLNEVWRQWDEKTHDFLMQTSILNEFSMELAQTVTHMAHCADILGRISTNRGFVITLDGNDRWYRYHHVFRDFLRGLLTKNSRFDEEELKSRAAEYYWGSGDIVRALSYYRSAGNDQGILDIINKDCAKLFLSVGAAEIIKIIDGMSENSFESLRVCVCYGWALAFAQSETKAIPFIAFIKKQLKKNRWRLDRKETERIRREVGALSFVFNLRAGDLAGMAENLMRIFSRPELDTIVFSPMNILMIYGYQFGYQYTLLNTIFGFFGCINQYMDFMEKTKYIAFAFMQGQAFLNTGALPIGRAEVLYQSGHIAEALAYLSQGLDESGLHGIAHVYLPGMLCLADIQKAGGEVACAFHTVGECQVKLKALDEISASKVADAYRAQLDLEFNHMDNVSRWEESAQIGPFDDIVSFHSIYLYFTLVRVLIKTGRKTLAHLLLNKIKMLLETFTVPNYFMLYYFLDAHLKLCEDKTQEACLSLLQLLRTGFTYGYLRFFADRGLEMKDLLELGHREKLYELPDSVPLEYMQRILSVTNEYIEKTNGYRMQIETAKSPGITPREREVLLYMARNLTNQQIADLLYVSLQTVKNHTSSIYRKLNVVNRMQAVSAAKEMGIIS